MCIVREGAPGSVWIAWFLIGKWEDLMSEELKDEATRDGSAGVSYRACVCGSIYCGVPSSL